MRTANFSPIYRTISSTVKAVYSGNVRPFLIASRAVPGTALANVSRLSAFRFNAHIQSRGFSTTPEAGKNAEEVVEEELKGDEQNNEEVPSDEAPVDHSKIIAELEAKLSEASEKLKEMQLKYRISLDNLEQVERINTKKLDNANLYAITRFSKDILDVADAFELAFKALDNQSAESVANDEFIQGIKLTEAQLHKTFEKYGIKRFDSLKQQFNPEIHEAMFEIPDESVDKNTILQVVFNGYMIHDRVLRAAKVGVSRK
ncbi:grpe protein like protein [Babesia gibsoni]|uniref:GrpE protein homolog n=1 Tax=Babesia gibsoni TaxID=33632 RepID=A0AAD8LRD3_BABGI|nr:grpe protein like protein [Babesia gibsoni]